MRGLWRLRLPSSAMWPSPGPLSFLWPNTPFFCLRDSVSCGCPGGWRDLSQVAGGSLPGLPARPFPVGDHSGPTFLWGYLPVSLHHEGPPMGL